jgi:hypothetical protein
MRNAILVLLLTVALATSAFAQLTPAVPQDTLRDNLHTGYYGEATTGNSQYIYIHVTMAGVVFSVQNGDWAIGNNTGNPSTSWYAFPSNVYMNAGGLASGIHPPPFIDNTIAPYDTIFHNDMPLLWNRGGVALDFLLMVWDMAGWDYDSRHITNILTDAEAATTRDADIEPFKNSFQLRAVFVRWGDGGTTTNYTDAHEGNFDFTTFNDYTGYTTGGHLQAANPHPGLLDADLVYTQGMFNMISGWTDAYSWNSGMGATWLEATSYRFNPPHSIAADYARTSTLKGLGIAPASRVTIAFQLLTPRTVTRAYRSYLLNEQILKVRVFGVPSDALD